MDRYGYVYSLVIVAVLVMSSLPRTDGFGLKPSPPQRLPTCHPPSPLPAKNKGRSTEPAYLIQIPQLSDLLLHEQNDVLPPHAHSTQSNRRVLIVSSLLFLTATTLQPINANAEKLEWQATPINKRTGVTVFDAERVGYTVNFVTYLSRFLLTFDPDCQRWWYERGARDIDKTANAAAVQDYRNRLFAAFSASVEVGLQQDYRDDDGPGRLLDSLVRRYSTREEADEARRQICLLFGLMEKNQPTRRITQQLAALDNGSIVNDQCIVIQERGSGYAPGYGPPAVTFPPPAAGEGYERATGRSVLTPSGRLLRVDVVNRGKGYYGTKQPTVTINPPAVLRFAEDLVDATQAEAKAFLFRAGPNKGQIERIQLTDPGRGYTSDEIIRIRISPPETPKQKGGVTATATAVLEYEVSAINVLNNGTGYAVERPIAVQIEPPPLTARINLNDPLVVAALANKSKNITATKEFLAIRAKLAASKAVNCVGRSCYDKPVVAIAYPESVTKRSVFYSFRNNSNNSKRPKIVSGAQGGELPEPINFVSGSSAGQEMLALLPAGVGLAYNAVEERYDLEVDPDYRENVPLWRQQTTGRRKIDPDFGPRGRAPIEREMSLSLASFLRFMMSGAICCSGVHLALTPIDVVKTKIQTNPDKYSGVVAFQKVYDEEGLDGFFQGWQPTFLGFFFWGGVGYALTELVRRVLTEELGARAPDLEVPIILFAASMGAFVGSFIICPFESVRIRSVSQTGYAPNIVGVLRRMVNEEGIKSLFAAVPLVLAKEVPFAMAKFTVFDLSTLYMYNRFPAAREDLQLSLLISLIGGTLGGVAASIVSNPADVTISILKKAKSDIGPGAATAMVVEQGGIPALFTGLPLRMIFYSLVVSLQFLVYDSVRFALGIGTDDLKLYLNVLGGALNDSSV